MHEERKERWQENGDYLVKAKRVIDVREQRIVDRKARNWEVGSGKEWYQ